MKEITLVSLNSPFLIDELVFPNLGILSLSAFLKENNVDVSVVDLATEDNPEITTEFVGISATTPQYAQALDIMDYLQDNGHKVILGGPHAFGTAEQCLEDGFDAVIPGEGESALLYYLEKGKVAQFAPEPIDMLPLPDRDAIDISKYHYEIDGLSSASVMTSRGCFGKCLHGDTLVNTIYGKMPIQEISEKYSSIKVLTRNPVSKEPEFALATNIKKTRINAELVRVTFDNGKYIDCTPDHKFMVFKNGNQSKPTKESEVEAQNLCIGSSVRAIHFYDSKGSVEIVWRRGPHKRFHRVVMEGHIERKLNQDEIIHHIDGDYKNNHPSNLLITNKYSHMEFHPEMSERMKKSNPAWNLPKEHFIMLGKMQKGKKRSLKSRINYRNSKLGKKNPNYKNGECCGQKSRVINHKIASVEKLPYKADTYCMTVDGYDWFYADDVLVHNCSFCSSHWGRKMRFRSAENVYKEFKLLKEKYGFGGVMLFDDVFAVNKKRIKAMHELLKPLNMKYRAFARVDSCDKESLSLLKDMGLVELGAGLESASDKVLTANHKGTTVKENQRFVDDCYDLGIRLKCFFIVGLPGETEETAAETYSFIEKNRDKMTDFDATILQPFPGSSIWQNPELYDIQFDKTKYSSFYKGRAGEYNCNVSTSELSAERILFWRDKIEKDLKRR